MLLPKKRESFFSFCNAPFSIQISSNKSFLGENFRMEQENRFLFIICTVFESGIVQTQDGGKIREISENFKSNSSSGTLNEKHKIYKIGFFSL